MKGEVILKNKPKVLVLLSGGLDSRLALKIMQEQDLDITAIFFKLPFGTGCCSESCSFNFSQLQGVKLRVVDCTKGKNLQDYISVIKDPQYKRGSGLNPCVDCRIFIFKKAKEILDEEGFEMVVTGEVLGERPMSQMKKSMDIIEEETGLKGRLLRPLSAKLFPETEAEKKGIIDREKLFDIQGRRREKQISLAEEFNISYPSPAGGCLLCEKTLKKRLVVWLERGFNDETINLINVGRHFLVNGSFVVIGRDEKENKIIESFGRNPDYNLIIPNFPGPNAIILNDANEEIKEKINQLIKAYSKEGSLSEREKFDEWKL